MMADFQVEDYWRHPRFLEFRRFLMNNPDFVDSKVRRLCNQIRDNNHNNDIFDIEDDEDDQCFPPVPLNLGQLNLITRELQAGANLRQLYLVSCFYTQPDMLQPFFELVLPSHPTLVELYLEHNNLQDDHVRPLGLALKMNTCLKVLWLIKNAIGDSGMRALAEGIAGNENSVLKHLDVEKNRIGDSGIIALSDAFKNKTKTYRLENLCLGDNMISDAGYRALGTFLGRKNVPLTLLRLPNNAVFLVEAVRSFSAGVKEHPTLQILVMDGCFIASPDAIRPLICDVLSDHPSLLCMNLSNNNLTDNHSNWIASALHMSKIRELFLVKNPDLGDTGVSRLIKALRQNNHLESLHVGDTGLSHASTEELISLLRRSNYKLTSITYKGNPASADAQSACTIQRLCCVNKRLMKALELLNQGRKGEAVIPWKRVFKLKDEKPELVYEILRNDPSNMAGIMGALADSVFKHKVDRVSTLRDTMWSNEQQAFKDLVAKW